MSLDVAVAVPFKQRGTSRMGEGEFVVALSLDRDWFSPDQAKRLIDVAAGRGLLTREDDAVVAAFDPADVTVPEDYEPDQSVLREQSTFERMLDALVAAGHDKQSAVAEVNDLQRRLGVNVEAAAALYATRRGVDVADAARDAREEL
ncbi:hypothetical protein SAMN04487947_2700 [Halogeometricum rufum]|jgi:hypothetical protein|uniref:DUF2240 family protein n=3 Tax=Halogeometricum TaxID=60846 RepID=A0A1I6I0P8_9EURY|nr:DUF2240 family protein [Halogeometricum rufum]SFR60030.1 hypothetical protein SAMN04487947_2700 [Halogeometricum rufum]